MGRGLRLSDEARREIGRLRFEGLTREAIARRVGCHLATVSRVLGQAGGVPPRRTCRSRVALRMDEREEISRGLGAGRSLRAIAAQLGRAPSTVAREVAANGGRDGYRAWAAERRAAVQAARPKVAKLASNERLRAVVVAGLRAWWSPAQIAARLRVEYPDEPEMWVSHETIYQSIYVQGRGALRKELAACLRTRRSRRRPRAGRADRGQIPGMVHFSQRPAEAADRAVPGHWEGDLIIGKAGRSAIGTLVERSTRTVMLVRLEHDRTAEAVRDALIRQVPTLPDQLWRSLTWDQGREMACHAEFTVATGIAVYFCDPHSPWQRGSNENTNGLLRQYFPRGTDLSVHTQADLDAVAAQLNARPRQTLNWMTPSEKLTELVATTA